VNAPPLVVHIIYRLGVGGLENGLVNLINRIPPQRYRHVIICLKDSTDFSQRIKQQNVLIFSLHRKEGHDLAMFVNLFHLLRKLEPDIVHTRNLATLECQFPAWLAGVHCRVHGEHGWDVLDPGGTNVKYQWLRRFFRPLVQCYIPLSMHLKTYLQDKVKIRDDKIRPICNGVNTEIFYPAQGHKPSINECPFPASEGSVIFGTVGRMHGVKDQMTLVNAFLTLLQMRPKAWDCARLVLVGDGPLRQKALEALREAGAENLAWLPGELMNIPEVLRGLDVFVLPSKAEGISNAILEAMATGLPVIATAVGGNPELVFDGVTGRLVEPENPLAMAKLLAEYLDNRKQIREHGMEGLRLVQTQFSLDGMVERYIAVYDELLLTQKSG
jgi:sugar transferase (PEP-CTERM/EpsH1 system associated)